MIPTRLLPAIVLAAGLLLCASSTAQPPRPAIQPGGAPPAVVALPVVPKSAGAFVTLKITDLAAHPDLKTVLAQLAKQPDALAGLTEIMGVSPLEIERVTLFWPRLGVNSGLDPILVVTTREPFNEARVLRNLKADPVFDGDGRRGGRGHSSQRWNAGDAKPALKSAAQPQPPSDKASPNVEGPKDPAPTKKKEDDECAASADGGIADPLFYSLDNNPFAALFLIDEHTLVFLPGGSDGEFANMALLGATLKKNATGPLADAIAAASKHTFAAGIHLSPLMREFDRRVPPEVVPYTALLAARIAVLTGDLDKAAKFNLTLKFDDATAAKRAAPVLEEGIATVAEKVAEWVVELKDSRRPFEKSAAPIVAAFATGLKKATVKADGVTVIATAEVDAGPATAKAFGELLQAVQSRKKAELRMNNLKQIGIALHAYHDANGRFPTNVYGPKGEVLLSWRVLLLPYLEEEVLYRQINQNEPWDGPNNKALIEKMPKVYLAPDREHAKGKTFYQGFVGPDPRKAPPAKGFFGRPWHQENTKDGIRIVEITDGSSNTIAVIEAGEGVIWSKPDDLPFGGPVPALGEKGWDRTPALRFDGSVFMFPTNLKPDAFWPYITINGGEVTEDLEDRRGPFGGGRGKSPYSATPAKEEERAARLCEVEEAERHLADLKQALRAEEAAAAEDAKVVALTRQLVQAGSATKADLAVAEVRLANRASVVENRKTEVALREQELQRAKAALGTDGPRPPK